MDQQPSQIATQIRLVQENIQAALKESPYNQNVRLMLASKFNTAEKVKEAYDCGIRHFGENYVDQLLEKSPKLPSDIKWHFIGHLQSNKCRKVLIPNLEYLETIDSIKLAEKVDKTCESIGRDKLKVFVQVNASAEMTKSGVSTPEEIVEIANYIATECKHLVFCGLMTIGAIGDLAAFKIMSDIREKVCEKLKLEIKDVELSMGMTADYEEAIRHGATEVRVGTLVFGERQVQKYKDEIKNSK